MFEGVTGPIKQIHWRIACGITLGLAAVMAWFGGETRLFVNSLLWFALYWAVFLTLLIVSLFLVVLDIRYIRLQYAIDERDLYRQTLGSEEFRKALLAAQQEEARLKREKTQDPKT